MLMLYPSGEPWVSVLDWLTHNSFEDSFAPGMVLFLFDGAGSILGGIASFGRLNLAGRLALALGFFLVLWILARSSGWLFAPGYSPFI